MFLKQSPPCHSSYTGSQSLKMSSKWPHSKVIYAGSQDPDSADLEKGLSASTLKLQQLPPLNTGDEKTKTNTSIHIERVLSPVSPICEGITPSSSVPVLSLMGPVGGKQTTKIAVPNPDNKKRPNRWILLQLWFNTYRKFFTFVTLLNLTGIIAAATGRFRYADNHLGALVLGNLLCAILMRNEMFIRFLYIISIYGLKYVSSLPLRLTINVDKISTSGHH